MIKGLERFQKSVKQAIEKLNNIDNLIFKLAEIAREEIQTAHDNIYNNYPSSFQGQDNQPTTVTIVKTDKGYNVIASGYSVLFIEYGTGITFNTPQVPRPDGVSNIGKYGYGLGKLRSWHYEVGEETITTSGNPAAVGITNAINKINEELPKLIRNL